MSESSRARVNKEIVRVATADSFQNVLARTGFGVPNLMEGTKYPITRLTKDYNLMNSLYRNSWIARRIIDTIPLDMMKNWIKYETELDPEMLDILNRVERVTRLRHSLLIGLEWGRLYGGAAALMMIEGQEEILEEPLDLDSIMPGDFKGLLVVDRWSGCYPQLELVDDISDPDFGLPKYYQFTDQAKQKTYSVHHSRVLRFIGDELPNWERQAESYWGASKIESLFEELKKRDNTSANIAGILFRANLNVLKISDMGEMLTGTNAKAQQDFYTTIQAQNWLMNNFGMFLMSKDDDFQNVTNKFEGLDDVYESFMMDVSGAAQIPVTKLFGRSPAGMNATGESDMRNYYDVIENNQESHLRPVLEKLLPVMCMSTFGMIPDDIDFSFNPIETPNDEDLGNTVKWKTEALYGAHDRGILSTRTVLKELKQMGDTTGFFTNITDEDINKASDEAEPALLKGMGGPDDDQVPEGEDRAGNDLAPESGDVDS